MIGTATFGLIAVFYAILAFVTAKHGSAGVSRFCIAITVISVAIAAALHFA